MFHWIEIRALLSRFLYCQAATLLIPFSFSLFVAEPSHPFAFALLITLCVAFLLQFSSLKKTGEVRRREGIFLVVLIWIAAAFFAAIPFYTSRLLPIPLDAFFEALSGLTTTGTTLIADVESANLSLLLWRSLLQWFGGIGVIVLFLMILPVLRVGGKVLYETEATGPIKEGISPLAKVAATKIAVLYAGLTLISFFLLMATNPTLPIFDALNLSLTTISTGGFSIKNNSIDAYPSLMTRAVLVFFMILGSINFSLYFQFFRKTLTDFRFFLWSLAVGCLGVALFLPTDLVWTGCFQAISTQTTTGYMIGNSLSWPIGSQTILLLLMFVGGMAGSTAGGIKTSRFYLLFQIIHHRLELIFRPTVVRALRIGDQEIDEPKAATLLTFFCVVGLSSAIGVIAFIADGLDLITSIQMVASFFNNVGINPSVIGLSPFSKVLSMFSMLLGRLEYFVVILTFFPFFWKK